MTIYRIAVILGEARPIAAQLSPRSFCTPRRPNGKVSPTPIWLYAAQFMRKSNAMAKLYFHYSTMNAGKSTLLLQAAHNYQEMGMDTFLLTANFDDRAGEGKIGSRIGFAKKATTYGARDDLFELIAGRQAKGPVSCVMVDEAQWLSKAQVWQLARAADDLGIPVMCYGLRVDFRGELFPGSATLLALADDLREVRTICHCGRKATMVIRKGPDGKALMDGDQVVVGGNETYLSLCRRHWREATET